jgi:hypothetical protein
MLGVAQPLWQAVQDLPDDFDPTAWDTLLLDALDALPEVGPSIVLASSSLWICHRPELHWPHRLEGLELHRWLVRRRSH